MSDLIERLRRSANAIANRNKRFNWKVENLIESKAADLIEQQQARIAKLEQREAELAATVERLRDTCQLAFQTPLDKFYTKRVNTALFNAIESDPPTSLNAVKREVARESYLSAIDELHLDDKDSEHSKFMADRHADQRYPDKE